MAQLKRYNGTSWENVGGSVAPKTSQTTSDTDTYSCNYVNDNLTNIKSAIDYKNPDYMGDVVVESIRSKNMLDSSTIVQGDIVNQGQTLRMTSRQALWLEAGTYTLSTNIGSSYQFGIQVQNVGVPPLSAYPTYILETGWLAVGTTKHTFTINTAGWFTLMLRRSDNGAFTSTDITNLKGYNYQLETGDTATTYSPYFSPANEMSDKLSQIAFKTTNMKFEIKQYSGINLNTLADNLGVSFIYGTSLTNAPVGALGYIITICILDSAYAKQFFMAPWSGSPEIYTRTKDNGTWSSWYKINAVAL